MFKTIGNTLCGSCLKPTPEQQGTELGNVPPSGEGRFDAAIEGGRKHTAPTPGFAEFKDAGFEPGNGKDPVVSIDLGPGAGRDTNAMIALGWHVTAIDIEPKACDVLKESADKNLKVHQGTLLDAGIPDNSVDMINTQRCLPFIQGKDLQATIAKMVAVLRPGGYLCASFFGPEHSWAQHPEKKHTRDFHSKAEVEKMLTDAKLIIYKSNDVPPHQLKTAEGEVIPKWHEIRVIVRKPPERPKSSEAATAQALRDQIPRRESAGSLDIQPLPPA